MTRTATPAPTVTQVLRDAAQVLCAHDSARLDAELLLCAVLETDRAGLYARAPCALDASARARFARLVEQRAGGVPVAYLVGRREFWSLSLRIDERVLVPRPETETVVEMALTRMAADRPLRVADAGTGSGAIALAIAAERRCCAVVATDICAAALAVAGENAARLRCDNVALVRGDWLRALGSAAFDVIVSNPPYVAAGDPALCRPPLRHEPSVALAAGRDGLSALRRIIAEAPRCLRPGGHLLVEHGHTQGEAVRGLMRAAGFDEPATRCDLGGRERVTAASRGRSA